MLLILSFLHVGLNVSGLLTPYSGVKKGGFFYLQNSILSCVRRKGGAALSSSFLSYFPQRRRFDKFFLFPQREMQKKILSFSFLSKRDAEERSFLSVSSHRGDAEFFPFQSSSPQRDSEDIYFLSLFLSPE